MYRYCTVEVMIIINHLKELYYNSPKCKIIKLDSDFE